jgi:uncharacterized iron-regulated membrane protein
MSAADSHSQPLRRGRFLPEHRTIWRWHFYAGLFCVPFVLWLATTGCIYLFKPQIEAYLDRPYDNLVPPGASRIAPFAEVKAALAAVPGSNLHHYELARTPRSAAQVAVGKGLQEFRVYVHPVTGAVLKVQDEDSRPMLVLFHLHGELLAGDRGSMIVELAASWAFVMILTGVYLWWPRDGSRFAGVLYPRVVGPNRLFWRDIHSVTGVYVSVFTVLLLFSGLPWAKSWGNYFKEARKLASAVPIRQDWTTGRSSELEARQTLNANAGTADEMASMPGMNHSTPAPAASANPPKRVFGRKNMRGPVDVRAYAGIDRVLPTALNLNLAYPVDIDPPATKGAPWVVRSDSQNRMLRDTYSVDGSNAAILAKSTFYDRPVVEQLTSIGISAHEGHLFGWLNQAIGVFTAVSLIIVAISSVVLWWNRRPEGVLGAPKAKARPEITAALVAVLIVISIALPMLGTSVVLLAITERLVLRRLPGVSTWLGLTPTPA